MGSGLVVGVGVVVVVVVAVVQVVVVVGVVVGLVLEVVVTREPQKFFAVREQHLLLFLELLLLLLFRQDMDLGW